MSTAPQEVITAAEIRNAEQRRVSLVEKFANRYGLEPNRMMATLKATAFRGDVSNEQMAALLIVADHHGLNPWTREIFAFPSQNGIVPVVSVDGWAKLANSHPQFDGMEFQQDDEKCTCTIYRKDRSHPITVTEYMVECKKIVTDSRAPWNTHPKRMLRHKAMIQCARIAFSFAGIYDPDEAERVLAAEEAIDVTPGNETIPAGGKLGPKKLREVVEGLNGAVAANDGLALNTLWNALTTDQRLFVWGVLRSWERSAIKKLQNESKHLVAAEELAPWAVGAIKASADLDALETTWRLIQDAFAERDQEVPLDINTVFQDRKSELGA